MSHVKFINDIDKNLSKYKGIYIDIYETKYKIYNIKLIYYIHNKIPYKVSEYLKKIEHATITNYIKYIRIDDINKINKIVKNIDILNTYITKDYVTNDIFCDEIDNKQFWIDFINLKIKFLDKNNGSYIDLYSDNIESYFNNYFVKSFRKMKLKSLLNG